MLLAVVPPVLARLLIQNYNDKIQSSCSPILAYLEDGCVPKERELARLVMERSSFDTIDGIFYYENTMSKESAGSLVPIHWHDNCHAMSN